MGDQGPRGPEGLRGKGDMGQKVCLDMHTGEILQTFIRVWILTYFFIHCIVSINSILADNLKGFKRESNVFCSPNKCSKIRL